MGETRALYDELADWWPLVSSPEEYAAEAAEYLRLLRIAVDGPLEEVLELGSGGGNNASHLNREVRMTLVDRSRAMLDVSRALNPACEHVEGDMRSVRLGRTFDAVFVHDAIDYITTEEDLAAVCATAFAHARPGGCALLVPDFVRERYRDGTDHGGHDGAERALRYLEWWYDPSPLDTTYVVEFAFLLRLPGGAVDLRHDRHVCGLFARATWLRLLGAAGFTSEAVALTADAEEPVGREAFVARRLE